MNKAAPDWRGLCEELLDALDGWHQAVFETGTGWVRPDETYLLDRACAALAQPEPEGRPAPVPVEGEVAELVAWLRRHASAQEAAGTHWAGQFTRAADLLERQAAPVPVAVSERLPGPEDCDAEGRLWAWCKATKEWCLLTRWHYREESERNAPGWASGWPYWLPATALPLPSGEVEP